MLRSRRKLTRTHRIRRCNMGSLAELQNNERALSKALFEVREKRANLKRQDEDLEKKEACLLNVIDNTQNAMHMLCEGE